MPGMATHTYTLGEFEILDKPGDQSIQALLGYWQERRGDRAVPLRRDIDPLDLKTHLPCLFMLDVIDEGRDFRYRLVGTTIADINGRDVTGNTVGTVYAGNRGTLDYAAKIFGTVLSERRPVFTRGSMFWRPEKSYRRFEAGYFPVSSDGTAVDIILAEVRFS